MSWNCDNRGLNQLKTYGLKTSAYQAAPADEDEVQYKMAPAGHDRTTATPRGSAVAAAAFSASMVKFAASGFKTVDEPLHSLRVAQCQTCEHRRDSQCSLCRCFIDKKAWLPHEDCPVGRWTA
jgi:hypothetical protein